MIALGQSVAAKQGLVASRAVSASRIFAFGPKEFWFDIPDAEWFDWPQIIQYRHYYRLLREIDRSTLLIVNECLRTQQRHDLTYNCLRNFLQQTERQILFQRLPIIDTFDDFMVLVDLDTRSRWRGQQWSHGMLSEIDIVVAPVPVSLNRIDVATDAKTRDAYAREKRNLIDGIGLRDPHTIPRKLHLFAGRAKVASMDPERLYVGRNNRFKLNNLETYSEAKGPQSRTVFEFCHRFLDFSDFLTRTDTTSIDALVSDLRVDSWYFDRFTQWSQRLSDAYAAISV